jgi:predicted RNase H-like nuclease (RuvC/YqgF family)
MVTGVRFLLIAEAAALVARDPQTIRNWANTGKVRRRNRGRLVEYHVDDLLAAAGLAELDVKDREIARLRVELEQARRAKDAAEEMAARRRWSNANLRSQAAQKYAEKDAQIVQYQSELAGAAATVADLTTRNQAGRRRLQELEAQVRQLQQQVQQMQQQAQQLTGQVREWQQHDAAGRALLARYATLVETLMGVLTRREHREEAERLIAEVRSWEDGGGKLRRR